MELLLRTNFDMPRPPGGVFDPLRYLSLGAGQQQESAKEAVEQAASAPAVYEVARPVLQGCHAIPTKLKILLDRVLSSLPQEEVVTIVAGCGWQLEDYQRGYKLKDAGGSALDRWNMCTKLEEPLILQQFLKFRETRTITQQLILQDLTERSMHPLMDKSRLEESLAGRHLMEKSREQMIEKNREQLLEKSREQLMEKSREQMMEKSREESRMTVRQQLERVKAEDGIHQRLEDNRIHSPEIKRDRDYLLQTVKTPRSTPEEREIVKSPKRESPPLLKPGSPITSSIASSIASLPPTSSPMSPIFPKNMSNGIPLPPSSMPMPSLMSSHLPMFPFPGMHGMPPHMQKHDQSHNPMELNGALNLSRPPKYTERDDDIEESDEDCGSRRSSVDMEHKRSRDPFPEELATSFISPTTGKKRVQCNVCMKTFCDKGALKIHFSAVHLREMHKCTVGGCTMMFSSRRSRNRHSSNPNPKLHTPQVKRKISSNDGRTHPGPLLNDFPILPKESFPVPNEGFPIAQFPNMNAPGQTAPSGMPPLPFPGLPGFNPFMPPDLKSLQQYQKDLQRFSDLQKLYSQTNGHRDQDSDNESNKRDDLTAADISGNRKRKSQNPTKRPCLDLEETDHISSDSASDEGFPDPMMEDDDDELDNISSGDEAV